MATRTESTRDEDSEHLQAAIAASLEPDYMADILAAELLERAQIEDSRIVRISIQQDPIDSLQLEASSDEDVVDTEFTDINTTNTNVENEIDQEEDDNANVINPFLDLPNVVLLSVFMYVDEESVGQLLFSCHRLKAVILQSETLFSILCKRIFASQNPQLALAITKNRFQPRKFGSWFEMFRNRPRVRFHGFYWIKFSYIKKPELNMWTEVVPGTILQCTYYRYFSFQRDGTVLYAMIFRPPQEASAVLERQRPAEVQRGIYRVEKDRVAVKVPTSHNVVFFHFHISNNAAQPTRGKNVTLILDSHYAYSNPDETGYVTHFDTNEEEFNYYRSWRL